MTNPPPLCHPPQYTHKANEMRKDAVTCGIVALVALSLYTVVAFEITSEIIEVYVDIDTNEMHRQRKITFTCAAVDYGLNRSFSVVDAEGFETNITIECTAPFLEYYMELVGYVPSDCRLSVQQTCLLRDTSGITTSGNTPLVNPPLAPNAIKIQREQAKHTKHHKFKPMWGFAKKAWGVVKKVACTHPAGAIPGTGCGGGGPDEWKGEIKKLNDLISGMQGDKQDLIDKYDDFFALFQQSTAETTSMIEGLTKGQVAINETIGNMQTQIDAVAAMGELNFNMTLAITDAMQNEISHIKDDIDSLQNQTILIGNSITALAEEVDSALKAVVTDINDALAEINSRQGTTNAAVMDKFTGIRMEIKTIYAQIHELSTLMVMETSGDIFKRDLTKLTRQALDNVDDFGFGFHPMLASIGAPPLDRASNDIAWKTPLADISIFHATDPDKTSGGIMQAVQHRMVFYCSTTMIVESLPLISSWNNVLLNIGPPGCAHGSHSSLTCNCWISHVKHYCNTNETRLISGAWNASDASLVSRADNICTSGVIEDPIVTHYTNGFDALIALADICEEGAPPAPSVHRHYIVSSASLRKFVKVGYSDDFCKDRETAIYDAMQTTVKESETIHFSFMYPSTQFIELSSRLLSKAYSELIAVVDGELPQRMIIEFLPLIRINDVAADEEEDDTPELAYATRREGRCATAAFVSCTTELEEMVPVYVARIHSTRSSVRIFQGNTSLTRDTGVTFSDGGARFTPTDNIIVGDITNPTRIRNIPYSELSIGSERIRQDKATYFLTPPDEDDPYIPQELTAASFVEREGVQINHYAAVISPFDYEVGILPNGTCDPEDFRSYHGTLCRFREFYILSPSEEIEVSGVTASLYFTASPRPNSQFQSSYEATVVIPEGEIRNTFVAACPISNFGDLSDTAMVLQMNNPQATHATIHYRVERHGDCCDQTWDGQIDSAQTMSIDIPLCLNTDPLCTTPNPHILVYRQTFSSPPLALCSTFNFTLTPDGFVNRTNLATTRTVAIITTESVDAVNVGLNKVADESIGAIFDLILLITQERVELNIPTSVNFVEGIQSFIDEHANKMIQITTDIDQRRVRPETNWTNLIGGFENEAAALRAAINETRQATLNSFNAMSAQINASLTMLEQYQFTQEALINASILLNEAITKNELNQIEIFLQISKALEAIGDRVEDTGLLGFGAGGALGLAGMMIGSVDMILGLPPIVNPENLLKVPGLVGINGDNLKKAAGWIEKTGKNIGNKVENLAKKAINEALNQANSFRGMFENAFKGMGNIIKTVITIVMVIGLAVLGYFVYKQAKKLKAKESGAHPYQVDTSGRPQPYMDPHAVEEQIHSALDARIAKLTHEIASSDIFLKMMTRIAKEALINAQNTNDLVVNSKQTKSKKSDLEPDENQSLLPRRWQQSDF